MKGVESRRGVIFNRAAHVRHRSKMFLPPGRYLLTRTRSARIDGFNLFVVVLLGVSRGHNLELTGTYLLMEKKYRPPADFRETVRTQIRV